MAIFKESPGGVPRRWSPSDETLEQIDIELVHFYSDGCRLAGYVYKPKDLTEDDKRPGIVLVDGYVSIKEIFQANYAEAFAKEGYVCVTFDYRGFGESDGRRGREFWDEHVEDVRNAITYLQFHTGVDRDRIGLWGTSYGGAVMPYVLAIDERAKACVAQAGFGDGRELMEEITAPEYRDAVFQMVEEDRRRRVINNDPLYADPFVLAGHEGMARAAEEVMRDFPQMHDREIPLQFVEKNMEFSPVSVIEKKGSRPLMCISASKDDLTPPDNFRRLYEKAPEPKEWIEFEVPHYDLYEGEIFKECIAHMLRFYGEYL